MYDGVGRRQDKSKGQFLNIGQHSLNGRERKILFRANGDGTFTDVAWVNGADRVEDGRGLSVLDFDGDGREDLLLRNYRQPAVLLRNQGGSGHWLEVALVGVRSNRDAVGARLRLHSEAGWQTREVHAGSAYLSGSRLVQHFGLGRATQADSLEIAWPSGLRTTLGPLAADRRHTVVEDVPIDVEPTMATLAR
jgi:enediyne biosynthesis protein E4